MFVIGFIHCVYIGACAVSGGVSSERRMDTGGGREGGEEEEREEREEEEEEEEGEGGRWEKALAEHTCTHAHTATTEDPTEICLQSNRRSSWSSPLAMTEDVHENLNTKQNVDTLRFPKSRVSQG